MLRRHEAAWIGASLAFLLAGRIPAAWSQLSTPAGSGAAEESAESGSAAKGPTEAPHLPDPEGMTRLPAPDRVWIDAKNHEVLVDGYVALREGYLEMFACTAGSKEHESVVGVETKAATVHAALLAVGAKDGHPVRFQPKFEAPAGTEIEIEVRWLDAAGEWQKARAQQWIREVTSKKEMSHDWVFAGSGFWTDEQTGKRNYMAEGGDFICVSNFTTATLDVPFESSQSNEGLLFEAYTERIPALGTPVRLVLKPVLKAKDDAQKKGASKDAKGENAGE